MITDEQLEQIKFESVLGGTFSISRGSSEIDTMVAFGDYIVDLKTFKLMLIWKISNTMPFKTILHAQEHKIKYLKSLNQNDKKLQSCQGYNVYPYLYSMFYQATTDNTNRDLINRYKVYLDN